MKKLALAAILAGTTTLGVAGIAAADMHRGGHGKMIERLDVDGDGQITKAEVDTLKAERFAEADANGDGALTMEEIEAHREAERAARMEARKQAMFERRDTDGNGVISIDEFETRGTPMFDRIDADSDGVITTAEIEAMKEKHGERGKRGWHRRSGPTPE